MFYPLSATDALARHPQEVAALCLKINAARKRNKKETLAPLTPEALQWGYDVAVRIGPDFQKTTAVGRAHLEAQRNSLLMGLMAVDGRRNARAALDNDALLAGPDASLPWEVLGRPLEALPAQEPRLWLWQPDDEAAPGWAAYRIEKALQAPVRRPKADTDHPNGVLLTITRGTREADRKDVWFDGTRTCYTSLSALFEAATATKPKPSVPVDVAAHYPQWVNAAGRWCCAVQDATLEELLGALRKDPGFVSIGDPMTSEPKAPAAALEGRYFDVHETLSEAEQASLKRLVVARPAVLTPQQLFQMMAARMHEEVDPSDEVPWVSKARWRVALGEPVDAVVAAIEQQRGVALATSANGLRPRPGR